MAAAANRAAARGAYRTHAITPSTGITAHAVVFIAQAEREDQACPHQPLPVRQGQRQAGERDDRRVGDADRERERDDRRDGRRPW